MIVDFDISCLSTVEIVDLLYQLLDYRCDSCLISLFMSLLVILQFSYFIMLFSCHISAVVLDISLCTCLYARAVPFYTHTHHGRVLTTLDLHVQILDGLQMFVEAVCFAISWSFCLFYSGTLIFLASVLFLDSCYIRSSCYSSLHYMISCVVAYMCYCSIQYSLQFRFIACFGLLKA